MKKLLLILSLFLSIYVCGQSFPINSSIGAAKNTVLVRGNIGIDTSLQFRTNYSDTTTANLGNIDDLPGALIRVNGSEIWLRNQTANAWIEISGSGSTYTGSNGITLTGSDFTWGGTLTGATTISGNSQVINFNSVHQFNVNTSQGSKIEMYSRLPLTQDGGRMLLNTSGAFLIYDTASSGGEHNYLEIDPLWFHIRLNSQFDTLKISNLATRNGLDSSRYYVMLHDAQTGHTIRTAQSQISTAVQTLQQVLDAGDAATSDMSVSGGNVQLLSLSGFTLYRSPSGRDYQYTISGTNGHYLLSDFPATAGRRSYVKIDEDSLSLWGSNGSTYIHALSHALTATAKMVTWDSATGKIETRAIPTGGSSALSSITAATTTNTIDNGGNQQTWDFNSLTTEVGGLRLRTSSVTSGALFRLTSTSTAATGNTQNVLEVNTSGANANSTQTTYASTFANSHTGTASTNIAGYFNATGGSTNYAVRLTDGSEGAGKLLMSDASGNATWTTFPWNSISNPTGTQTLSWDDAELNDWTNGSNTETFWTITNSALTTGTALLMTANALTTGNVLSITSTSTAKASGNELFNLSSSGANASSSITNTGIRASVTNTGTSSINTAIASVAEGANENYVFYGTGTSTPTIVLQNTSGGGKFVTLKAGTALSIFQFSNTGNFGISQASTVNDGGAAGYSMITYASTYNSIFGANLAFNQADISAQVGVITTSAKVALKVRGASSQSVNLVEIEDNSANDLIVFDQNGGAIFNENSTTANFRIESDGNANMLYVDGTNNRVGIGATPTTDVFEVTGNISLMTAGNKLKITTGANASAGTGTFSGGTVTINTTAVTANSLIFVQHTSCSNCGVPYIGTVTASTSFVVNSNNASDASTFSWFIIN